MHRTMKIFCHFYTEMFCTGCGCRQCQAEVKIGEQKFTTSCGFVNSAHHSQFCTSWPILHKLADSAQVGRFCTSWPILHKILHVQNHSIVTSIVSVYMCIPSLVSQNPRLNFTKFSVHVTCGYGSVLF